MSSRARYTDETGTEILVEVPWESNGSGIIPPPTVSFWLSETRQTRTFVYAGDAGSGK